MAITMKGIFRGLKIIAQIFTVQREHEHEIEIGYPTDVRHVSHIGFGNSGAGGSCPSWMNEFRGVEEVAPAASITSAVQSRQTSWASIDFEQPVVGGVAPPAEASTAAQDAAAAIADAGTTTGAPKRPATRLKKARASSPGSSARSSSWRSTASFATGCGDSGELRPAAAGLRAA